MLFRSAASALGHLGLVALLVSACSSKGSGSGSLQTQAYAQTTCDQINRCSPIDFKSYFADAATCTARLGHVADSLLSLPGVSVTQAQLDTCVAKIGGNSCDASLPTECDFHGTLAIGAPCSQTPQCASGSCFIDPVQQEAGQLCGRCTATVGAGADCTKADCDSTLVCFNDKCAAPGANGAACDETKPCIDSLACIDGKCSPYLGDGADCGFTSTSPPCDSSKGLNCNPTTNGAGKCGAAPLVNAGQKCGIQPSGGYLSCAASSCVKDTCVADSDEGGACDPANGPFCGYGYRCVNGKCLGPAAISCD